MALMTAFASYAQNKPASWINNVKLSGYGIVQYQSSSKVNDKSNSFNLRLARVSLDGRILDDFYWKAQIQFNTLFYAGDMKDILTDDFVKEHGRPDVIITDPPRAGMHPDVVNVILNASPERIVYVSCNPATQARDLALMDAEYKVAKVQPVDMFPHTPHVENVVLLVKRTSENNN